MRISESRLRSIIRESIKSVLNDGFSGQLDRTNIVFNGLNLELSMAGEDISIEYAAGNIWVLAIYSANDKTWHIQENLDDDSVNDYGEDIIDIGDTKSMPEALIKLSNYVHNKKNNIHR